MVGMVCTGIFAKDVGLVYGQTSTFLYHLLAMVIVGIFAFGGSLLLYKVTDMIIPLRVSESQEREGLDLSQHGETALAVNSLINGNGHKSTLVDSPVAAQV